MKIKILCTLQDEVRGGVCSGFLVFILCSGTVMRDWHSRHYCVDSLPLIDEGVSLR